MSCGTISQILCARYLNDLKQLLVVLIELKEKSICEQNIVNNTTQTFGKIDCS